MSQETEVEELLSGYPRHVQELAWATRELLMSVLVDSTECIDHPARLLGYSYGPGYTGVVCTILLSKTGVKLGISRGSELPDPKQLMTGAGKVHRHVPILTLEDVNQPGLKNLLKSALSAWKRRNSGVTMTTPQPRKQTMDAKTQDVSVQDAWFDACPPTHQPILRKLRELIFSTHSGIIEEIKWQRPIYSINRVMFCYLQTSKNHLSIGFHQGSSFEDPHGLLEGVGKGMRHVKIKPDDDLNSQAILAFVRQAVKMSVE